MPIALVVVFPPTLLILGTSAVVFTVWTLVRDTGVRRLTSGRVVDVVVQALWLGVAVLGLLALVGDVRALT